MKQIAAIVLLIVLISSCSQPKNLVYQDLQHFKLNGFDLNNSAISMDLKLYNPNNYGIKLRNADIDIYVNESYIGKMFVVEGSYVIPRVDTFLLPVMVDVDLKNVLPNALKLLFDKTVLVKLTGKIKAGKHGVYVTVPINYEGKQEI